MEIRPFELKDKSAVLELFNSAFGKSMHSVFWEWRYLHNPFYNEQLIDLMWDGDALVGHYALWPLRMSVNQNVLKGALSMTTMTHPSHGGKGIFTKLAQSVYKRAFEQSEVEVIWGFPNRNSHYGFINKLDWKDVGILPMLSIDSLEPIDTTATKLEIIEVFTDKEAQSVLKNSPSDTLMVNKTVEYLNWRYIEHPTINYSVITSPELNGFLVVKVIPSFDNPEKREIDILEWNLPDGLNEASLAIELIMKFANKHGIESKFKVNTWVSVHDPRFSKLEKLGFCVREPLTFMGKLEKLKESRFNYLQDWTISMGDSDVY